MGTTAVVCLFHDDCVTTAYVGDSRLYRFRDGVLEQVSRDHSLVEELIDRGFYSREEAAEHVSKNIVTRALGVEPEVDVDIIEEPVQIGDIYLLCSDGLSDMVDSDQIRLTLEQFADNLNEGALALVEKANEAGGKDNISVVLARVDGSFARRRRWFDRFFEWF